MCISNETALGPMKAAPTPASALKIRIIMILVPNAVASVQMTQRLEPTARIFLWPKMSPRRPPMRTNAPWVILNLVSMGIVERVEGYVRVCCE